MEKKRNLKSQNQYKKIRELNQRVCKLKISQFQGFELITKICLFMGFDFFYILYLNIYISSRALIFLRVCW